LLEKWPEFVTEAALEVYLTERGLKIPVWTVADLEVNEAELGLAGSPTQVHKINYVVLESTESKEIPPTEEGIRALIQELIQEYIVG
jgi:electron transfer flavoprotein beta subunit